METETKCAFTADKEFLRDLNELVTPVKKIYYRGNLGLLEGPCVAVVGSRSCTAYGIKVAEHIAGRLAENQITVISGLARGIDTVAHRAAVDAGGKTVGVLACGTDICYPASNGKLQKMMENNHLILSEHPDGTTPRPYFFPLRNRIISCLSDAVVVVEAGNRSGALITAEYAAEQGKILYAVPGNITSRSSHGCNMLIRDGVTPLILADDIITDLGLTPVTEDTAAEESLGTEEKIVLNIVRKNGEVSIEEIVHKTNKKAAEISGIITVLEMKGLIFFEMGKVLVAKF